ncbi:MAG: methyl-accepting chemotaxis protein [Planctomycetaceae bacterium]|jgi:methyl-accepting chemotaxis protein|nr:methyl-accepting chemotaxis protein [Planctomycetaceae bacterium]
MLNKFKIGTKLLVGFLLVILLLVVVGGVGYYALTQCQSGFKDLTAQIAITQGISETTDNVYLAQIASANFSATRDTSFSAQVTEYSHKADTAATKTGELMAKPENKETAKMVADNAKAFEQADENYKQLQLQLNDLGTVRLKLGNDIDVLLKELADGILETYKNLEKEQKPITIKHVQNYGTAVAALETTEIIRRANRDLLLAVQDPKNTEQQENAVKEAGENYVRFDRECAELLENLVTQEAKDKVIQAQGMMKQWRENNAKSRELLLKQTELQKSEDAIAGKIATEAASLVKGVGERVAEVSGNVEALVNNSITIIIVAVILAALVGVICAFVLTSNITTGLRYAVGLMSKVAGEGDLSSEVEPEYLSRSDEIGALAHGLKSVLGDYHAVDNMATTLADGDWRVNIKSKGDLDTMNQGLAKMVEQVNQTLAQISESVKQVATGSGEVSSAAVSLSSGAQESAASLEEITASMSEISSQTKSNAENAGNARDLAQKATKAASEGQTAMTQMTEAMGRITKNSEEIQRVIKVIDDIAFQTNLLALNAAVEAARAGQHGKGFAVVAEEVRNLAARSAKAAKETANLIETSGREIQNGGEVATHTSEVLNTIVEQIKQTTDLVAGIAVASNEQAQGVNQVTVGLQQIDSVTQQNTAAAEESASAANEMSGMATNLQEMVARFKLRA